MDFDIFIPLEAIQDNMSWMVFYPSMMAPVITIIGIVQLDRLTREE